MTTTKPSIPSHIKNEFTAVLTWFAQYGARNLGDNLVCIAMEDATSNEEIRYAVAVNKGHTVVPLFFLGAMEGWVPHTFTNAKGEEEAITHHLRPTPTAEEIIAAIPADALTSFQDEELICTAADYDEDEDE
jgi:hypothetical protein